MFGLSRKKEVKIRIEDLDGNELREGDHVISLRYELGECSVIKGENGFEYFSVATGIKMHYAKMIDASSGRQKVKKLS